MNSETAAQRETNAALLDRVTFGFWMYLMSDCLLFASLFAVYAVLHNNTFGGPPAGALFSMSFAFKETLVLLTSNFIMGLAALNCYQGKKRTVLLLLALAFLLGVAFLYMEFSDFAALVQGGNSWQRSGFLSSFFALVGTHGAHVAAGALWMLGLMGAVAYQGLTSANVRRLTCLTLFWHFLDLIWIFIFSIVYLMSAL